MDTATNYPFKVGALKCVAINDGTDTSSPERLVTDVPSEQLNQALLECGYSPTEIIHYYNCLYIQAGIHRILVDVGWGKGTQRRNGALLDRLKTEGITPTDISMVIITHGDLDHVGGITTSEDQLTFPKADYILSKDAWDFWSNEETLTQLPEHLTVFGRKMLPLIRSRLKVVRPGVEFLPGFQLIPAPGHRPGHVAVHISSSGKHLLHLADTVGHPIFMEHPSWHWPFDTQPSQAEKDKRQLLSQAVAQKALVFGSHFPFPAVGRVTPHGEGWRWQPLA
jgi:glyoxylase-like metal-dependent hydrolase (beta-lactamase superfamily II)